jgi:hypothetical protein
MKCKRYNTRSDLPVIVILIDVVFLHVNRFFSPQNREVTQKLIRYTWYMILIPVGTFYISFYGLFKGDLDKIMWSGLMAVIATNCVIAAYVLMAWKEDEEEQKQNAKNGEINPPALIKSEVKKEL